MSQVENGTAVKNALLILREACHSIKDTDCAENKCLIKDIVGDCIVTKEERTVPEDWRINIISKKEKPVTLGDTATWMNSSDWKDRVRAEFYQIDIRATKLEEMLIKYKSGELEFKPNCSYELLYEQLIYMRQYRDILADRMHLENIDF